MRNRIRKLRVIKKITQRQLSLGVGVSQQTISDYEQQCKPLKAVHNLRKIAKMLDVKIDDLFY